MKWIRCGPSRCRTTGSWATHRRVGGRAGSHLDHPSPGLARSRRDSTPRRIRRSRCAALPRRRCWSSIRRATCIGHWGGPGKGYDWPDSNHGITIDYKGNVWIGGNGRGQPPGGAACRGGAPTNRLRPRNGALYSRQHGAEVHAGRQVPDADRQARPAARAATTSRICGCRPRRSSTSKTNEVYVADGYGNHRVIVFDADTGKYKRHWGAYGHKPDDTDLGNYNPGRAARPAVPQSGALRRAIERSACCTSATA